MALSASVWTRARSPRGGVESEADLGAVGGREGDEPEALPVDRVLAQAAQRLRALDRQQQQHGGIAAQVAARVAVGGRAPSASTTFVIRLYEKPFSVATVRVLVGRTLAPLVAIRLALRLPAKSWKVWTSVARAESGPSGVRLWPCA